MFQKINIAHLSALVCRELKVFHSVVYIVVTILVFWSTQSMLNEEVLKLIWYIPFLFANIYSILSFGRRILKCFYELYGLCFPRGLEEGQTCSVKCHVFHMEHFWCHFLNVCMFFHVGIWNIMEYMSKFSMPSVEMLKILLVLTN